MNSPIVVVDACCNHMGDINVAKKMITEAKINGATFIKFQKRDIDTWSLNNSIVYSRPHPDEKNSFGDTYESHRRFLEFNIDVHRRLADVCNDVGIGYSCSVFDTISAKEIIELNPAFIKIPSACNNNYELIKCICRNYGGEIHVSVGMTNKNDIREMINVFVEEKRNEDVVLYACTSEYPVSFSDVCLYEICYLIDQYSNIVKDFGYSGHHKGVAVDIAAYTLGATHIERHFTLNRNNKGTDQIVSILPCELKKLVGNLNDVNQCLKYKRSDILETERKNLERHKWKTKETT